MADSRRSVSSDLGVLTLAFALERLIRVLTMQLLQTYTYGYAGIATEKCRDQFLWMSRGIKLSE